MEKARHRVKFNMIEIPRDREGIGLVSLIQKVRALANKLILLEIIVGGHPLKKMMQANIQELSMRKQGVPNFSWVYVGCSTMPLNASKLMLNLCGAWNKEKLLIHKKKSNLLG